MTKKLPEKKLIKIFPSPKQFASWSMPNKATYIAFILGVIGFVFTIFTYVAGNNNSKEQYEAIDSKLRETLDEVNKIREDIDHKSAKYSKIDMVSNYSYVDSLSFKEKQLIEIKDRFRMLVRLERLYPDNKEIAETVEYVKSTEKSKLLYYDQKILVYGETALTLLKRKNIKDYREILYLIDTTIDAITEISKMNLSDGLLDFYDDTLEKWNFARKEFVDKAGVK